MILSGTGITALVSTKENTMQILDMSRDQLEEQVMQFGYSLKEVKAFSTRDLQECSFANLDRPDYDQ